jgi:tetratricopeptide (TPR) repeat protein
MKTLTAILLLCASSAFASIDIPGIVRQSKPAVVQLETVNQSGEAFSGTGFFISSDGLLLTDYHVIRDAVRITARTSDGTIYQLKKVCGYSEADDVAELQFVTPKGVPFLTLGSSLDATEGQRIVTLSYPLGLELSVSDGIIAGFRKNHSIIQFTAAISPGSSGGPILNELGKVIGVVRSYRADGENINYAVASETVQTAIAKAESAPPGLQPVAKVTPAPTGQANHYFDLAHHEDEAGDYTRAISDFDESIRLDPNDAAAYASRGVCYAELKRYQEAIDDYTKAIQCARSQPAEAYGPSYLVSLYDTRAAFLDALGQHSRAAQDRKKARELKGK